MKKINFIVERTKDGYSAYADDYDIYTVGGDIKELTDNIVEATNLHFQVTKEKVRVTRGDISLIFSVASFFDLYPINVKQFADRIGINYTLLSQYIQGNKTPSEKQVEKITAGLRDVGEELRRVRFNLTSLRLKKTKK